jgi:hypothetical protein
MTERHSSQQGCFIFAVCSSPPLDANPSLIGCDPVQWKFMHFHGQKTSRQNRYKSIYKDSCHKRTKLFRLLSLILFFTPDVHLRELKRVWADELVIEEIWRGFVQKLVSEWVEFVLYVSYASCPLEIKEEHQFDTTKLTVNCHARCKCRVSCHPRRHCCPTRGFKKMD